MGKHSELSVTERREKEAKALIPFDVAPTAPALRDGK